MALELTTRFDPPLPVELPPIDFPQLMAAGQGGLSDLERIPLRFGQQQISLGELFVVRRTGQGEEVVCQGATERLQGLGRGMRGGNVRVCGDVGDWAGAEMSGGRLEIQGRAGDWLAAENRGGVMLVAGDVGRYAAASRPGRARGGNGGTVVIAGSADVGLARRLRRGIVVVGGAVRQPASEMLAGTIILGGTVEGGLGMLMKRGTIVCRQNQEASQIEHLVAGGPAQPLIWNLIRRDVLAQIQLDWLPEASACFQAWHGDSLMGCRGEVWMAK